MGIGDRLRLPLPGLGQRAFKVVSLRALPDAGLFLRAEDAARSESLHLTYRGGIMRGSVDVRGGRSFELKADPASGLQLLERSPEQDPQDDVAPPPAGAAGTGTTPSLLLPPPSSDYNGACGVTANPTVIDLLIIYDAQAAATEGGIAAMRLRAERDVEGMNAALTGSQTKTLIRMVDLHQVIWIGDGGSATSALPAAPTLKDASGTLVTDIRDQVGADEVLFYYNGGSVGTIGYAYIMNSPDPTFGPRAYAVASIGGPMTVFSHELGHNLGCNHESGPGAYPFSNAFNDGTRRTIMCAIVGNVNMYSGPDLVLNGETMGSATQDNARSISLIAPITAAFRTPVVPDLVPQASVLSPADGSSIAEGQWVTLTAAASGASPIVQVDLYCDGVLLSTQFSPPYSVATPPLSAGTHYLWARTVDASGLLGYSCPVQVQGVGNLAPWHELTWTSSGQMPGYAVQSGSTLTLGSSGYGGSVSADSDLFVYQQFCGDGELIAQVPAAPAEGALQRAFIEVRGGLDDADPAYKLGINAQTGYQVVTRVYGGSNLVRASEGAPRTGGWLRLTRASGLVQGYISSDGSSWSPFGPSFSLATPSDAWAGLEWGSAGGPLQQPVTYTDVTLTSLCDQRTPTPTMTVTCTITPTATPTATRTDTRTASPTRTATGTFTDSPTASPTRTVTETRTATCTYTDSPTPSPSRTPTATRSVTPTFTPSRTPTETRSFTPTSTSSPTPTATRSETPSPTASCSGTPTGTPSCTASPTISATASATPSDTASPTDSPTGTHSPTDTDSPTASPTGTTTDSPTTTGTPTFTSTATPTGTATASPTSSETFTVSCTATPTPSSSQTASPTIVPSATATPTPTETGLPTATFTPLPTQSASPTEAPVGDGEGALVDALALPNPLQGGRLLLAFKMDGSCRQVRARLYTSALVKAWQGDLAGAYQPGWNQAAWVLPELPSGYYSLWVEAGGKHRLVRVLLLN